MIHYHGTPITPKRKLKEVSGAFFCVSYANPQNVAACHEYGQGVMLDNGAFSFWNKGTETDWNGYYSFCDRWLEHWTTWAVIPDVIGGSASDNDALIREWPFGDRGAPVWHLHEPLGRLERLVEEWPLVCFGSSGEYSKPDNAPWRHRMWRAMDVACDEKGIPKTRLHMLRGLKFSGDIYPFYSSDSTNVAQNHNRQGKIGEDIFTFTRRIDSQQTPSRWIRKSLVPGWSCRGEQTRPESNGRPTFLALAEAS